MKKILTLVFAVVMIMAMAVPSFAAETGNVEPAATCTHSGRKLVVSKMQSNTCCHCPGVAPRSNPIGCFLS